jgi:hypothetical protein
MTPTQALAASAAVLKTQRRVVATGTIHQSGDLLRILSESTGNGSNFGGTIVVKIPSANVAFTLEVIALPTAFYINGDPSFWKAAFSVADTGIPKSEQAKIVAALAGKWIKLPPVQGAQLIGGLGKLKATTLAAGALRAHGTLHAGTPKPVAGAPALPIVSSSGETVWLATTGQPLPLEVSGQLGELSTAAGGSGGGLGGLGSVNGSAGAATGQLSFAYPARLAINKPAGAKTLTQAVSGLHSPS